MRNSAFAGSVALLAVTILVSRSAAAAPHPPSGNDVKGYLLENLSKMEVAANQFVADARAYQQLVNANAGDTIRAFRASPAEMQRLVSAMREEYKAMDSFGYETIEGIVAGVPALADFDVSLDSGVPRDQAGGGTPVAPVVLQLANGEKLDHEGCLFTYIIEPMLWGANKQLVVEGDLNKDGKIDPRESLPRAEVLIAAANDVLTKISELHRAAIAWKPSTADYFSAIITMTPTLSGYFDDWKDSRYAGASSGKFSAVSRVSDMRGIMFSVAVLYSAVRDRVATKDPALASSIQRGFDRILEFIERVDAREKKAGGKMSASEIDELAEQAKQKADKLVPQVEQASAILGVEAPGA